MPGTVYVVIKTRTSPTNAWIIAENYPTFNVFFKHQNSDVKEWRFFIKASHTRHQISLFNEIHFISTIDDNC